VCLTTYSPDCLQRVTAAGFLGNKCVIEAATALLILICVAAAGTVCHAIAPTVEIVKGWPILSDVLLGVLVVGLVSFIASMCLPCCKRARPIGCGIDSCSGGCRHCNGMYLGAEAGEFIAVVFVMVLVYLALVGVVRAAYFTYQLFHQLAKEGSELLETTVSNHCATNMWLQSNLKKVSM
jgi:hypothetical protein